MSSLPNAPKFATDVRGNVAVLFALAVLPLLAAIGGALDYSRATRAAARLQAALDSATLVGAAEPSDVRNARAEQVLLAGLGGSGLIATASFATVDSVFVGTARVEVPTVVMKVFGRKDVTVAKVAHAAVGGVAEDVCLLTYGVQAEASGVSMTFNGTPSMSLNGCTVHSNTSIKCNGHGPDAAAVVAVGAATNCAKARTSAPPIPDEYEKLSDNIVLRCGNSTPGYTWRAGHPPTGNSVVSYLHAEYLAHHVCGDLTFTGTGEITDDPAFRDTLIVVENGGVTMDRSADITASRTTIVITGDHALRGPRAIEFPKGKGHSAKLTISAPRQMTNPWHGMALYQDPRLISGVDMNWGPGASLVLDGVAYFPRSNFVMRGNAASGNAACSKMAFMTLTVSGNVEFSQNAATCAAAGVEQNVSVSRLLK